MITTDLTHRFLVSEIQRLKSEIDLIKSLPSQTGDIQGKILIELNNQLEKELIAYHKLLMEIKISK